MRAGASEVVEDSLVRAAGLLKGVGQDRQPGQVEVTGGHRDGPEEAWAEDAAEQNRLPSPPGVSPCLTSRLPLSDGRDRGR